MRDTRTTSRTLSLISSFVNAHLVFYDEDPPNREVEESDTRIKERKGEGGGRKMRKGTPGPPAELSPQSVAF